jgi:AraC-like DNA-binding protein
MLAPNPSMEFESEILLTGNPDSGQKQRALASPENTLPVHEVALKWGFTHMGRFAAKYRATFGVYPSETAKRVSSGS